MLGTDGSKFNPALTDAGRELMSPPSRMLVSEILDTIDWQETPIGAPSQWEPALKAVAALMFDSRFPMFLAWGEELTFLYNDAYAPILGKKHPAAFSARFHDIGRRSGTISFRSFKVPCVAFPHTAKIFLSL